MVEQAASNLANLINAEGFRGTMAKMDHAAGARIQKEESVQFTKESSTSAIRITAFIDTGNRCVCGSLSARTGLVICTKRTFYAT